MIDGDVLVSRLTFNLEKSFVKPPLWTYNPCIYDKQAYILYAFGMQRWRCTALRRSDRVCPVTRATWSSTRTRNIAIGSWFCCWRNSCATSRRKYFWLSRNSSCPPLRTTDAVLVSRKSRINGERSMWMTGTIWYERESPHCWDLSSPKWTPPMYSCSSSLIYSVQRGREGNQR